MWLLNDFRLHWIELQPRWVFVPLLDVWTLEHLNSACHQVLHKLVVPGPTKLHLPNCWQKLNHLKSRIFSWHAVSSELSLVFCCCSALHLFLICWFLPDCVNWTRVAWLHSWSPSILFQHTSLWSWLFGRMFGRCDQIYWFCSAKQR